MATVAFAQSTMEDAVPAERANQRLWSITVEYENLLRLQKEHQELLARRREAEIAHLRAVAEMLSGDSTGDAAVAARLRAREEETALVLESKQRELELLTAVLVLRDRQITDLRRMCEAKRLRIEMLQHVVPIEKPDVLGDASQASEAERLRGQAAHLEASVGVKRAELRQLASTLEARKARVAELEAAERELDALPQEGAASSTLTPAQSPQKPFESKLQSRVEEMRAQLANAQSALNGLVRRNQRNDQVVREMADGASPTVVLDKIAGVHEKIIDEEIIEQPLPDATCSVSPNMQLTPTLLEVEDSIASQPTPELSGLEWSLVGSGLLECADALLGPPQVPLPGSIVVGDATMGLASALSTPHSAGNGHGRSSASPVGTQTSTGIVVTSAHHTQVLQESRPWDGTQLGAGLSTTTLLAGEAFAERGGLLMDESPRQPTTLQGYSPHPHDAVDAKVAEFVSEPRNRLRRALFRRLSEGEYMYGTRRARLRPNSVTGQLEATEEGCSGGWEPIEEFARRLERSQSSHLQRARDRAKGSMIRML